MLYAITDRRLYGNGEVERRAGLLQQTAVWAANGVSFLQLREKDLPARALVELARATMLAIRATGGGTRLLVNGRPDVAVAAGADGVHLPSGGGSLTPKEARAIFSGSSRRPYISVACHTLEEVEDARQQGADGILFSPVFEKIVRDTSSSQTQRLAGVGIALLQDACRLAGSVPVFALGGVTAANAAQCLQAGAAGVAAIRLMHGPPSGWLGLKRTQ